jgi:hypothetical protein
MNKASVHYELIGMKTKAMHRAPTVLLNKWPDPDNAI